MNILGVKIDEVSHKSALDIAANYFVSKSQHKIFTPNPEMLVKAQKDGYFKSVLNSGDLNLCDGFGLWLVAHLSSRAKRSRAKSMACPELVEGDLAKSPDFSIERIPGVDFMLDICRLAEEQGRGIYLLGSGSDQVVNKTAENLQKQFPKLNIVGHNKGMVIEENFQFSISNFQSNNNGTMEQLNNKKSLQFNESDNYSQITDINSLKPDILFVAFGMGKQEKWIYENLAKIPSVKIAMGVGGAFDYISGNVIRAPRLLRKIGLEWLYRLLAQPKRIKRILNATYDFLRFIIKYDLKKISNNIQRVLEKLT
jgi:N-acetylglucosaminyldiphosphoundecaprenol N-acetyl-beta-D-mannosaminyltransferase